MSMMRCYCGNIVDTDEDPEGFYHKPGHFICTFRCSHRFDDRFDYDPEEREDDDLHDRTD